MFAYASILFSLQDIILQRAKNFKRSRARSDLILAFPALTFEVIFAKALFSDKKKNEKIPEKGTLGSFTTQKKSFISDSRHIGRALATRWHDWVNIIIANQDYYTGLNALRNATYSNYLTQQAALTDSKSEQTSIEVVCCKRCSNTT